MKTEGRPRKKAHISVGGVIAVGFALLFVVLAIVSHFSMRGETLTARRTMDTLKQQCVSFNKLVAADRTKSLFRISDLLRDVRREIKANPENLSDEYLEQYVDGTRISGIAVLDEELRLVSSGYTRQFNTGNWEAIAEGKHFQDIVSSKNKILLTRLTVDGEYYDVCAMSRTDASGIVIGFYKQPSGLILGTESDLESLISGLYLESHGQYAIAEDGIVRVSSDATAKNTHVSDNPILEASAHVANDGALHLVNSEGRNYLVCRSGCEGFILYIYYPISSVSVSWIVATGIFLAVYFVLLLLYFIVRNRALYENSKKLEDSNAHLTETVKMLQALETIYFALFYVDIENDTYETIYIPSWLVGKVAQNGVYTDLKRMFVDTMVVKEFKEEVDGRMSIGFIRESLNRRKITDVRKSFYTDYQALREGKVVWCRVSATVVDYSDDGNPAHILALLQDVDVEKAKEAEYQARILKEAQDAKIANNAKSEFLRHMSHDIRTPINGIRGYIEIASQHPDDLAIQNYCREKSLTATNVLLALVNGLLDMSKLESGDITLEEKPFDLTVVLDEISTILSPQATKKGVRYEILRREALPVTHVIGSPRYVSQVIMNMAGNAVKYSKPDGWIRVNTTLVSETEDTVTYEFVCADNGIGMSEEFQKRMFEPFTQEADNARTTFEGAGLGLSIVKKLVDAMGGTIICKSQKDVGTEFHIVLTFAKDKNYRTEPEKKSETNKDALQGMNVLIAEDNDLNMEIAELLLKDSGANVTKAWNGTEAVDAFKKSAVGYYDIIFMDIMMPEMSGLDAAKAIRSLDRPDAKTVFISAMSANAFQDDVRGSIEAGMDEHLSKPVDEEKFLSVAAKARRRKE